MQTCKSKGLNWSFLRFSGGLLWMQRGIPAMARSGGNTASRFLLSNKLSPFSYNICIKIKLPYFYAISGVLNFANFAGFYFCHFIRQICKKGIKFSYSSILDFILIFSSLNFLTFRDKLRQAKLILKVEFLR